jgi:hypothetical protein
MIPVILCPTRIWAKTGEDFSGLWNAHNPGVFVLKTKVLGELGIQVP